MPGTWVTCEGYVLTPHLGWYLYYTMPLSNAWVSFLRGGTRKKLTKTPSQRKRLKKLGLELYNVKTNNGPVSRLTLALATVNLNSRIHQGGLSAREIWTRRDQVTGAQLPFVHTDLIQAQHETRLYNHEPSAWSKTPNVLLPDTPPVKVGDLVMTRTKLEHAINIW